MAKSTEPPTLAPILPSSLRTGHALLELAFQGKNGENHPMRTTLILLAMNSLAFSKEAAPNPMAPIENDPDLPRVLLIGDSISIGYTLAVREMLAGVANVHRPPTNCGPTLRGLESLETWLGEEPWDVIHFNWGLHDLKYIAADAQGPLHSAKLLDVAEGKQMVPLDAYAANLERLLVRLKKTGAALIWCATTPVPEGAKGRVPGEAARYNDAAASVMRRHGVPINDLHALAAAHLEEIQRPANVHFTPEGSRLLAGQVMRHILPQLPIGVQIRRAQGIFQAVDHLPRQTALPALLGDPPPAPDRWPALRSDLCQRLAFYEYGFAPAVPSRLRFQVLREDRRALEGKATKREVRIHFGPRQTPPMDLLLYVPNGGTGPAPVFLGLNFHGNQTVTHDPEITMTTRWVPSRGQGVENHRATAASRGTNASRWPLEAIIARGYAVASAYHGDLDPDFHDDTNGIQPHLTGTFHLGQEEHQWASLRVWAYGLSRAADYLVQDADIDRHRIAVMGHSRNGKTALVAGAFDERFSLVISNQSGCGGAALSRRRHGETVRAINTRFPHWFNGAFKAFNDREDHLPVDQHTLLATIAPRPLLICSATGDDWADPEGEFLAAKAASVVYDWLGVDSFKDAAMPGENELLNRTIGYHIRPGKHGIGIADWTVFMDFADAQWAR